jgi:predicted nucleic acid-binding protein
MTKLFIDSDIILDLLIKRNEYDSSAKLFTLIDKKLFSGFTSPIVIANVHYIMTKYSGKEKSIQNLKLIRKLLNIVCIDEEIIDEALNENASDFEDSIQYIASFKNEIDFIITRNVKDYKGSKVPVLTAKDFLEITLKS